MRNVVVYGLRQLFLTCLVAVFGGIPLFVSFAGTRLRGEVLFSPDGMLSGSELGVLIGVMFSLLTCAASFLVEYTRLLVGHGDNRDEVVEAGGVVAYIIVIVCVLCLGVVVTALFEEYTALTAGSQNTTMQEQGVVTLVLRFGAALFGFLVVADQWVARKVYVERRKKNYLDGYVRKTET